MGRLSDRIAKDMLDEKLEEVNPTEQILDEEPEEEQEQIDSSYDMYNNIIARPVPKGSKAIELCGRPIDFSMLEDYVVHKLSPKQMTAHMRFSRSKTIEEIKGYSKKHPIKFSGKIIWIIILLVIMLIGGFIIMTTDIGGALQGMFGF